MNRAVQKIHQRRCALKNNLYGGGLIVNPDASFVSENGVPYAVNQHYSDCYAQGRPGALDVSANPEMAQTAMAGGQIMSAAQLTSLAGKRGGFRSRRLRGGGKRGCGCNWKLQGGQCGNPEVAWLGGRRTRKQRGGRFEMVVAQNIGGDGPIAEPVRTAIPCDARAGMQNPFSVTPSMPDMRAAYGYSLTPNTTLPSLQAGGASSTLSERVPNFEYAQTGAGNAYPAACYKAPGSEMPVYPATSAGFNFTPSTQAGATLPDGVTAFNEVVAHTARLGGGYTRSMRKGKKSKKSKKSKRNRRH